MPTPTGTEVFILKAQGIHGKKYDYSEVQYIRAIDKIQIICGIHGVFSQTPHSHLAGRGCPACGLIKRIKTRTWTTADFIARAKVVHGDTYDYLKADYGGAHAAVVIVCPIHGEFKQTPANHLAGHGCALCGWDKRDSANTYDTEEFIATAKKIHKDRYDYSQTEYKGCREPVTIKCKKHNRVFEQIADYHISGFSGCTQCGRRLSHKEDELFAFIRSLYPLAVSRDSKLIKPKELDIVVHEKKLAFEYNGVHWHSTKRVGAQYHKVKTVLCKKAGYRLIHVWEDDWLFRKDIMKSFLRSVLVDLPTIFARKTVLREITKKEASCFLQKNHIQGSVASTLAVGAFIDNKLVSVCTYIKRRARWELNRHACLLNIRVVGALGKHIAWFKRRHQGEQLVSFCDLSMFVGGSYEASGFTLDSVLDADYKYVINNRRIHKFNFRHSRLLKFLGDKYDPELSEVENMKQNGYYRIFDCGKVRYVINC